MLTSHHNNYVVTLRYFKRKLNEIKETFRHKSFYKILSNNKDIFEEIFNEKFAKKMTW